MSALRAWFAGRTVRERRLVALMGLIAFFVLGWLLVVRPLLDAEAVGRERYDASVERLGAVRDRVAALAATDGQRVASARALGAVDLFVAQSAADAGFALDRNDSAGADRTEVAIGTARPTAALSWLNGLERSGVTIDQLSIRPAEAAGTVAITASLRRVGA